MYRTALRPTLILVALALAVGGAFLVGSHSEADSGPASQTASKNGKRAKNTPLAPAAARKRPSFQVHEWGTFTSMQGSSGVELDGLHHEGEKLPHFVHSFKSALPSPFRALGDRSRNPRVRRTRSKMETPVIYFHTDRPLDVEVTVHFVRGLMSHYYPAPTSMTPDAPVDGTARFDLDTLASSMLHWRAHVRPDPSKDDIPAASGNHYAIARAVDAAKVRVATPDGDTESERFLFYRGLGRDNPDIHIIARGAGRALLHNAEGQAIPAAFAIEMRADRGRFVPLGSVADGALASFDLDSVEFTDKRQAVAALSEQVFAALKARGLYDDEARAMVDTWADQWFASLGTRVVYVVPTSYIERTLPLSIAPAPDRVVRVFVGRIEYLTPEEEALIEGDLRATGDLDREVREPAMARLASTGRFMEPRIRRIAAITRDPVVRDRAAALLRTIDSAE